MPARIVVQSGVASGTTYWIERSVTRIGSDAQADISLPSLDLEPYVATIEYRNGRYRVHNRSPKPLFVGGQTLEPQQFLVWHEADLLELPDGTQLAMECDTDSAPSLIPSSRDVTSREPLALDEQDDHLRHGHLHRSAGDVVPLDLQTMQDPARIDPTGKKILPCLVIAGCLIGSGLLLIRVQLKSEPARAQLAPAFDAVVREARDAASRVPASLLSQLQYAEAALVAGNTKSAAERYGRLRYQLLELREQEDVSAQPSLTVAQQQIAAIIEDRLGRLAK